jgi:hypothetical protein
MAYTTIDDPTIYFNTILYTGNGSSQSLTGVGFSPDWVWTKVRNKNDNHTMFDSVRTATKILKPNLSNAEGTVAQSLTSFDSDGFSIGSDGEINENTKTYVAWNWKAGGSASSNSDGSTTSTVSANTTAGFSIVSYTGAGATTYGHGLGATPNLIIIKKRTSDSGNNNWFVYHDKVITAGGSNKSFLTLNETGALASNGSATTFTSVSSTTFGVGTDDIISESSHTFIAYCFADTGNKFFKAGSYTGNGNSNGAFVYTGFKPAWVMIKPSSYANSWLILDNKRNTFNPTNKRLEADGNGQENSTIDHADFLSNGFKITTSNAHPNNSGGTLIYIAFAESPFVTSTGIPTTAR